MVDGWTLLVGTWAVVGTAGWIKDRVDDHIEHRREVQERKAEALKPPKATCECLHSLAYHDPRTLGCSHEERLVVEWERNEDYDPEYDEPEEEMVAVRWELKQCGCVRYTGPQPLHTLIAPDLTDLAIETQRKQEESS